MLQQQGRKHQISHFKGNSIFLIPVLNVLGHIKILVKNLKVLTLCNVILESSYRALFILQVGMYRFNFNYLIHLSSVVQRRKTIMGVLSLETNLPLRIL